MIKDPHDWAPFGQSDETKIGRTIKLARSKEFQCCCGDWKGIVNIHGFEQRGGYWKDNRKSWILYFHCPKCGHDTPLDIILIKLGFCS
jgi:hypothetical protein